MFGDDYAGALPQTPNFEAPYLPYRGLSAALSPLALHYRINSMGLPHYITNREELTAAALGRIIPQPLLMVPRALAGMSFRQPRT